jgi:hypothetical protein
MSLPVPIRPVPGVNILPNRASGLTPVAGRQRVLLARSCPVQPADPLGPGFDPGQLGQIHLHPRRIHRHVLVANPQAGRRRIEEIRMPARHGLFDDRRRAERHRVTSDLFCRPQGPGGNLAASADQHDLPNPENQPVHLFGMCLGVSPDSHREFDKLFIERNSSRPWAA